MPYRYTNRWPMLIAINLLSIFVLPECKLAMFQLGVSDTHHTIDSEDSYHKSRICRVLDHRTLPLPSLFQFEFGRCHRVPLTFCFSLFQLGVRIYHSSLCSSKDIHSMCLIISLSLIGHIRPFCAFATRLVREQETIIVTFIVASHVLNKTRTEISRQFLDEPSESLNALQRIR